jgi:hypothetical protein
MTESHSLVENSLKDIDEWMDKHEWRLRMIGKGHGDELYNLKVSR